MAFPISRLPEFLMIHIFHNLNGSEMAYISQVSRLFNEIGKMASRGIVGFLMARLGEHYLNFWSLDDSKKLLFSLVEERIYIMGGLQDSKRVDSFNPKGSSLQNNWKQKSNLFNPRQLNFEVLAFCSDIYVIGGVMSTIRVLETYKLNNMDKSKEEEYRVPPLPESLRGFSSVLGPNKSIYVFGGLVVSTPHAQPSNIVYSLPLNNVRQPFANMWSIEDDMMPSFLSFHCSASYKGSIWIAGGKVFGDQAPTSSVLIYNVLHRSWSRGPAMIRRRQYFKLLVINDELYAVGGDHDSSGRSILDTIEKINTDRWEMVTVFPEQRIDAAISALRCKIFVFGGEVLIDSNVVQTRDGFQESERIHFHDSYDSFDVCTLEWASQMKSRDERRMVGRETGCSHAKATSLAHAGGTTYTFNEIYHALS